ncbi:MAG: yceD 2 [Bacteroidetes bacterium]|nr:yceD 2 [Bacteroidota bacterium]
MAINLTKGSKIDIINESQIGSKIFVVGLGWDPNTNSSTNSFDLDASAFLVGSNGKIINDEYFVFYNNPKSPDGSVIYGGDNRTGLGDGDDEILTIDTSKFNSEIQQVVFCCSIDEAIAKRQNFSMIENAYIRIYEQNSGTVLATYFLAEEATNETAFILGRLLKTSGVWEFEAYPMGYPEGLAQLLEIYA